MVDIRLVAYSDDHNISCSNKPKDAVAMQMIS
jgi:hypothetical protein